MVLSYLHRFVEIRPRHVSGRVGTLVLFLELSHASLRALLLLLFRRRLFFDCTRVLRGRAHGLPGVDVLVAAEVAGVDTVSLVLLMDEAEF